jgi:hypothetical protein
VLVVGRLLLVGAAAGTLIGATVVPVTVFDLSDGQPWEGVGAATGAMGGLVLGVLTQLVVAAVLGVLRRRTGRGASRVRLHRVAQVLACTAAGAAALTAAALLNSGPASTAVAVALASGAAAVVGRAAVGWCLQPWTLSAG